MLRVAALSVFGFAAAALAHQGTMDATMTLVDGGDIEISSDLPVKSTKFSFAIDDASDLDTGVWAVTMSFDKFAANSTNHFINSVANCTVGEDDFDSDKVVYTAGSVVDGVANSTLAFSVDATDFSETNTFEVTCAVTYGFRTTVTDASASLETVPAGDHSFVDDDVETPTATFASIGSITTFSATITSSSDLSPYGQDLYDKMVADITAKAASLETDDYRVAATYELTITGAVVCGLASAVIGSGSGYACVSSLTVVYTGSIDALSEIKTGYAEAVTSSLVDLPSDTVVVADFETKEISGTCADGIVDNGEADVDCGYEACSNTCEVGQACGVSLDCATYMCIDGICSNSAASVSVLSAMVVVIAALLF